MPLHHCRYYLFIGIPVPMVVVRLLFLAVKFFFKSSNWPKFLKIFYLPLFILIYKNSMTFRPLNLILFWIIKIVRFGNIIFFGTICTICRIYYFAKIERRVIHCLLKMWTWPPPSYTALQKMYHSAAFFSTIYSSGS